MNIKRRGIDTDTRCPVCFRMDEDGGHCFFKCKFVRKCWQLMNLECIRLKLVDLKTAREVTNCILSMEENSKYETIALMWSWWDARNKANAGEKIRTVEEVVHQARSMVWEVSARLKKPIKKNHQKVKKWIRPPAETLSKLI